MIVVKCYEENKAECPMTAGGGVGMGLGSSRKEDQKDLSEKVALIRDLQDKESATQNLGEMVFHVEGTTGARLLVNLGSVFNELRERQGGWSTVSVVGRGWTGGWRSRQPPGLTSHGQRVGHRSKSNNTKIFQFTVYILWTSTVLSAISRHIESSHRVDTNYAQFRNQAVGPQWEGRGWSSNLGSHQIPTAAQNCVWRIPKRHKIYASLSRT